MDDSDEGEQEEDMGVWLVVSALRSVWRLAAALVVIYSVTLAIFPGVLAEDVKSQQLGSWCAMLDWKWHHCRRGVASRHLVSHARYLPASTDAAGS